MDKTRFYDVLRAQRSTMFGPRLSSLQVAGIEGILSAFAKYGDGRVKTLAYALATARREVGEGMVPVREGFRKTDADARAYVMRNYGHRGRKWYCYPAGPYGQVYYGRGYAQETWLKNYQAAAAETGLDLVRNPDLVLEPALAGRLLIAGLLSGRWNGHGRGIAYYLPTGGPDDLENARRTVNITDHWQDVAGYYREFKAALEAAGFDAGSAPRLGAAGPRPLTGSGGAAGLAAVRPRPRPVTGSGSAAARAPVLSRIFDFLNRRA